MSIYRKAYHFYKFSKFLGHFFFLSSLKGWSQFNMWILPSFITMYLSCLMYIAAFSNSLYNLPLSNQFVKYAFRKRFLKCVIHVYVKMPNKCKFKTETLQLTQNNLRTSISYTYKYYIPSSETQKKKSKPISSLALIINTNLWWKKSI